MVKLEEGKMNDPHVESLFYKAESPEDITYVNPPPLRGNEKEFSFVLEDGKLTISMIDHFAIEKEARVLTDPFVRAWEMKQALENNSRSIWDGKIQHRDGRRAWADNA